jgi:hypothetical protein
MVPEVEPPFSRRTSIRAEHLTFGLEERLAEQ